MTQGTHTVNLGQKKLTSYSIIKILVSISLNRSSETSGSKLPTNWFKDGHVAPQVGQ